MYGNIDGVKSALSDISVQKVTERAKNRSDECDSVCA